MSSRYALKFSLDESFLRWDSICELDAVYVFNNKSLIIIFSITDLWSNLGLFFKYLYLIFEQIEALSQEEALKILGFTEPFDSIRFGPFTGNVTVMQWFHELNSHFSLFGKARSFFFKPVGTNKTLGTTGLMAKERLQALLRTPDSAFIYRCYNHYCSPIGYEREPNNTAGVYYSPDGGGEFRIRAGNISSCIVLDGKTSSKT